MQRKTSMILAGVFAVILGAGFLVGCRSTCDIGGGPDSPGAQGSQAISDAGDVLSNVPGVGILGSLLKILGGVGVAYFGAKTVAKREVTKYDEAPFESSDLAKIEQAKAVAAVPAAKPPVA